jgi:hypothetical protein
LRPDPAAVSDVPEVLSRLTWQCAGARASAWVNAAHIR